MTSPVKALLVLAPVAAIATAAGAFGTGYALGTPKPAPPKVVRPKPPAIPALFAQLPAACTLVPKATVDSLVPAEYPTANQDFTALDQYDPAGTPDPVGSCNWSTITEYHGTQMRTLIVAVDLHPSTAQVSAVQSASSAFNQESGVDKGDAGRKVKVLGTTTTYTEDTPIAGLGDTAYQTFGSQNDFVDTGTATTWILRGNVTIEVQYQGDDRATDGITTTPVDEGIARTNDLTAARAVVKLLNSCTACASH